MQTIWWLILFDLRKSSCWWIKAVINIVVITLAYFTNQYRACSWFYFKVMIHSLHDRNAHTWFQFYLCTSRNDLNFSVDMYGNIALFIDFFIRKNGKQKAMSLMKSVITCLDGILPTTAWEILINMDFPCLLFVMEILK